MKVSTERLFNISEQKIGIKPYRFKMSTMGFEKRRSFWNSNAFVNILNRRKITDCDISKFKQFFKQCDSNKTQTIVKLIDFQNIQKQEKDVKEDYLIKILKQCAFDLQMLVKICSKLVQNQIEVLNEMICTFLQLCYFSKYHTAQ